MVITVYVTPNCNSCSKVLAELSEFSKELSFKFRILTLIESSLPGYWDMYDNRGCKICEYPIVEIPAVPAILCDGRLYLGTGALASLRDKMFL